MKSKTKSPAHNIDDRLQGSKLLTLSTAFLFLKANTAICTYEHDFTKYYFVSYLIAYCFFTQNFSLYYIITHSCNYKSKICKDVAGG